jgi:thiamine pyrophosphate-dependent acetolactate synthase large subunit-like protein
MGYALPAAISSKLHYPEKEVTALVGDGSFMMTFMELSTLMKYQTPIKIIVANNAALAAEKSKMIAAGLKPFGVELTNPDFSLLARSFGIKSIKVTHINELSEALHEVYADNQAVLLDVHIKDTPSLPVPN